MTEVHDSPSEWVAEHIQRYVDTDGADGQNWRGVPTLLLTTTGRKSGELRRTALIYGEHGTSYLVVASRGGAPSHPSWYLNLTADPQVQLQVGPDKFSAIARTATEAERAELWPKMALIWPDYDSYQAKTERQIPIVVLDRA
ncbi:MAG: nitroreductase family deazaflavin-dependent oxidoreductase [Jatrophihabitantaceae bacterium]